MQIDILTLFPEMFVGPFSESILKRAQEAGAVELRTHDIREWTTDKHRTADDSPYGGGPGMVMMVEPIDRALDEVKFGVRGSGFGENTEDKKLNTKTILLSAKGERFTQQKAEELSQLDNLVLICGHYEGVDERVAEHLVDEELSIGDFVLTGGELGAMVVTDAIVRLLPGVVGDAESIVDESHKEPGYLEYPHYTRPAEYKGWKVPEVLLSGNHGAIEEWRREKAGNANE